MFRKKLKQATPKEEADFSKRMEEANLTWKDKLVMILTAYAVILVPCILLLCGMCLLLFWLFGIL